MTDLLFKKELIFRDRQLMKIQINNSKFAVSLGFLQKSQTLHKTNQG